MPRFIIQNLIIHIVVEYTTDQNDWRASHIQCVVFHIRTNQQSGGKLIIEACAGCVGHLLCVTLSKHFQMYPKQRAKVFKIVGMAVEYVRVVVLDFTV